MRNDVKRCQSTSGTPAPPDTYRVHHDPDGSAKLSTTVIHALADAMGIDVTDTGFSLYDTIDPDALDRLFSGDDFAAPGHVAFTVEGYRVTVYSDGHIVVTPPA